MFSNFNPIGKSNLFGISASAEVSVSAMPFINMRDSSTVSRNLVMWAVCWMPVSASGCISIAYMQAIREYRAHWCRFFQHAEFWEDDEDSWGLRVLFERHGDIFVGPAPRPRLWSLLEPDRTLRGWDDNA